MTDKHADIRERYFGKARPGEYIEDRTIKEDVRRLLDELERLEIEAKAQDNARQFNWIQWKKYERENERLRKALEFYAEPRSWYTRLYTDVGNVARKALEAVGVSVCG